MDVIYCNEPADTESSQSGNPIERDYVKDALEQACKLHVGDFLILNFLTSAIEIERACQVTSSKLGDSVVVLPLHGKLQPENQQKVFMEYEKRKIVFSTNVAETSVTIPNVKCVIDTGLAKELCFDPRTRLKCV